MPYAYVVAGAVQTTGNPPQTWKLKDGRWCSGFDLRPDLWQAEGWLPLKKRISPHSFRHAFVTLSLDCGVSERDIQNSTGHADPRMISYYDRNRESLARNATHALTAYVAGAA